MAEARSLLGKETPRLMTQPLRPLTPRSSLGYECADFALQVLGVELLPWQKWLLIHMLETDLNGDFRYRVVLLLVARQNGKTTVMKVLALWLMLTGRVRMVLGAAQSLDIAEETWQDALDLIKEDDGLADEIATEKHVNGKKEFRLLNGSRYKIAAATRRGGRSLSVDLLLLDELREQQKWDAWGALSGTTRARPNAMILAASNAGDDTSVVLNQLRGSAIGATDPTVGIFEWSGEDDCALDDVDAWQQANPGLGYTISEQAIRSSMAADPPAVFRTETLCQRVEALDTALDITAWRDSADASLTLESLRSRISLFVDVSRDEKHVTLVGAAVDDSGRIRVQVFGAWTSVDEARPEVVRIAGAVKPVSGGWFKGGPASGMAKELRDLGWVEVSAGGAVEACMELSTLVSSRSIRHAGDPLLDAHVAGVSKIPSGDGWRFTRKTGGHCDAAYGLAGAVSLARTQPMALPQPEVV